MALAKTGGKASTKPTHFWLSHPFQKSRVLRSWNPLISARSNHHCLPLNHVKSLNCHCLNHLSIPLMFHNGFSSSFHSLFHTKSFETGMVKSRVSPCWVSRPLEKDHIMTLCVLGMPGQVSKCRGGGKKLSNSQVILGDMNGILIHIKTNYMFFLVVYIQF